MSASAVVTQEGTVRVKRTFAAPIEKAFQAWVDPRKMAQWFARGPKMPPVKIIQADGQQGGKYLIECVDGDRKSTRLNSSHIQKSRMPSSA